MQHGTLDRSAQMNEHDPIESAREAVSRGDWSRALDALRSVPVSDAEGLELHAQAAYGNGDFEDSIEAWEALYALRLVSGDEIEAARAAATLALFLMIDTALMAPVRGWVRRAERLLEAHPDAPPHALVAVVRTYERFMSGDMSAARRWSDEAIALGDRLGVPAAAVIGRVAAARLTIFEGRVEDGLDQLEEIATQLMSGEVDPLTTGMMYCELICAARGLAMHDRAMEWTDMMERWRHGAAFGGLNGRCRVHRAEMFRISGPCDRAEEEALLACEELRPWLRREFGWPLVELGNVRLRKGDLDGAETAYLAAHERMWSAQPGLALLRLEQGRSAEAAAMIAEAIAEPFDLPWKERPPLSDLRFVPLLAAQAEIASVTGDAEVAHAAAAALDRIAASFPSPLLRADALLADARVALLTGQFARSRASATSAAVLWADLGAPFDAAVARVVLATARRAEGNEVGAVLDLSAARSAFASFGAHGWVLRCDAALTPTTPLGPELNADDVIADSTGPDRGAEAVFQRAGELRTIRLGGSTVLVTDMKGLRYVERLLAAPGLEFHVLDLVAADLHHAGSARRDAADVGIEDDGSLGAAGLPVLDERAKAAYRRRLTEVEDDIAEAAAMNDPIRRELAERDRDYLIHELQMAVGLGARDRRIGGNAERARTAVTRSIRYALRRLAEQHPVAGEHLQQRVRTGTYCSYSPDPLIAVDWTV
jgi:tetratricopeptide (TPR) repeat protein